MFLTVLGVVVLSFLFAVPLREPHIPTAHEGRRSSTWRELLVVRESLLPSVIMAFIAFAHAGLSTFIPLYVLQEKLGNPALYFAVEAAFVLISRPIAGPLSDRWSRRAMILPGYALTLLGVVIVALAPSPSVLLIAAAIYGLGLGSAHPALMTLAVDRVPAGRRGLSMAQFQTFHDLGIAVGAVALGALLDLLDNNYSLMYLAAAAVGGSGLALYAVWGKEAAQDRAHSS